MLEQIFYKIIACIVIIHCSYILTSDAIKNRINKYGLRFDADYYFAVSVFLIVVISLIILITI